MKCCVLSASVSVCVGVCVCRCVCVCVFVMHGSVCAPHTEAHEWAIDEGVESGRQA